MTDEATQHPGESHVSIDWCDYAIFNLTLMFRFKLNVRYAHRSRNLWFKRWPSQTILWHCGDVKTFSFKMKHHIAVINKIVDILTLVFKTKSQT